VFEQAGVRLHLSGKNVAVGQNAHGILPQTNSLQKNLTNGTDQLAYKPVGMSKTSATDNLPETKRRLLDATMQLMLRQGFSATTVDQICAGADLTKGSFFHYFDSKDEIGEEVLDHFFEQQQQQFAGARFNALADPLEKLHGLLDFIIEGVRSMPQMPGCLIGNFAQELAHTHPRIRSQCDDKFTRFSQLIQTMLREAKAKYCPKAGFDPEGVSLMFVSLLQGSMLLVKARQDKALLAENLEHFRSYVDMLFGKSRRR
jgi:TetR/AcrR family transcriptional repressor of nem operon